MAAKQSTTETVHNKLKHGVGVAIKCPNCGYAPEDGKELRVRGTIDVEGDLKWSFEDGFKGIDWWQSRSWESYDERVGCPKCGGYFELDKWGFYDL